MYLGNHFPAQEMSRTEDVCSVTSKVIASLALITSFSFENSMSSEYVHPSPLKHAHICTI